MSRVTYHMSRVTCHVSHVTCHMSHFFFFLFFFFFFFGQSGEAYWWRVCYQRGLPRLNVVKTPLYKGNVITQKFLLNRISLIAPKIWKSCHSQRTMINYPNMFVNLCRLPEAWLVPWGEVWIATPVTGSGLCGGGEGWLQNRLQHHHHCRCVVEVAPNRDHPQGGPVKGRKGGGVLSNKGIDQVFFQGQII